MSKRPRSVTPPLPDRYRTETLECEAADYSKQSVAPRTEMRRAFFKIYVDGVKYGKYDANEWNWIDVGGTDDDEVRVPWATEKLLSIHPRCYADFSVEIHGDNSIVVPYMWKEGMQTRVREPGWVDGRQVLVRSGSLIKIMGHTIQAVDIPIPHPFGSGCWTCGQTEECTCGVS